MEHIFMEAFSILVKTKKFSQVSLKSSCNMHFVFLPSFPNSSFASFNPACKHFKVWEKWFMS